ncbi:MAG TPA: MGMT family protein [Blastocatellia bacterium]|nr:MGMT family protein [Blastocatellia bacterium]
MRNRKTKAAISRGYERVFEKIHRLVLRIPRGRVMTYGQIARLLDDRYSPRLVGWAMHATPHDERNIPWHRVINSSGGISTGRLLIHEPDLQRLLLESEGVSFNERGRCDLAVYQWSPVRRRQANVTARKKVTAGKKNAKRSAGRRQRVDTKRRRRAN